ncbi:Thermolabile hemolysin [Colletotrichum shisoi]|uniref:Thermolabile hemolysin n=1 Tax=Colletotrichum shisoi TaxID=2078593 RepID=A0A5Q4BFQ0_9PEZI|nr:Thermolabile hemolysin [Colletotrichum shisoi]
MAHTCRVLLFGLLAAVQAADPPYLQYRAVAPLAFSSIVVFGDSFSDNGNGSARASNNAWPSDKYYAGRFSNGPVWPEYVAANLSVPLYDYAVGGATSSNTLVQGYTGAGGTIAVPSVVDQVAAFLDKTTTPQGGAFSASDSTALAAPLFVVFAGANDILFNPNISASQTHQVLLQVVTRLRDAYPGSGVLAISPPDMSKLPHGFYVDTPTKQSLQSYTDLLGDLLGRSQRLAVRVDLGPLFEDFEYYAAPLAYGFDPLGKYGSCLEGAYGETPNVTVCEHAERRVYWDEYQYAPPYTGAFSDFSRSPTTQAHSWIANQVLDVLRGPF